MNFSVRALLLMACALAPFSMMASAAPDGGLLITRSNSQQWQLRLIAGSTAGQFNGIVESDLPFSAVNGVRLAAPDSVQLQSPTVLGATLASRPGSVDGVNFSVDANARLCLRDTGSSGVRIYRGDSLATATLVTAPLALTSIDSCGDATAPVLSAGTRKYHPGHYVALLRGTDTQAIMAASIKPGVVGFMKRYSWSALEPTKGVYQFAEVRSDLNWAAAHGMRLIVMIEDKTFKVELPTPTYLNQYALRNHGGGYTVVRWAPAVATAFKALVQALGDQFDGNANFEGLATQETAPGLSYKVLKANGYTPEKYRDLYIDILTTASRSMPSSRIFWFMNFFPVNESYIASVASAVAPLGVLMGGPDVMPDNPKLVNKVYPFYNQFQGRMPLFGQVEGICYQQLHLSSGYKTKYWTMLELFGFARSKLHANYMFWVRVPTPAVPGAYSWLDALPVIASNPVIDP